MGILGILIDTAAAAVFIVPLFCFYGKCKNYPAKKTFYDTVLALYFAAVLALVGFPGISTVRIDLTVNLLPVIDNLSYLVSFLLNMLLFVPMGLLLPFFWKKYQNPKEMLLVAGGISLGIEMAQIFTHRTTDILDVIANAAGAMIGYWAVKILTGKFEKGVADGNDHKELYRILGAVALIQFFLQPMIASYLWSRILSYPL